MLARRNGVLVLMSIELILNAVNINLVALGALRDGAAAVRSGVRPVRHHHRRCRGGRRTRHRPAHLPQPDLVDLDEIDLMSGLGRTPVLEYVWIIPALTFVSFRLILFFGKRLPGGGWQIGVALVGVAFALSVVVGVQYLDEPLVHPEEGTEHGEGAPAPTAEEEAHAEEAPAIREAVTAETTWFTVRRRTTRTSRSGPSSTASR